MLKNNLKHYEENMEVKNQSILASSILGISLIISVALIVSVWRSNYNTNQTIRVTGSANMKITSDLGILRGTLSTKALSASKAYKILQNDMPVLLKYFASKGFPKNKIAFSPINSYPNYKLNSNGYSTGVIASYNYSQRDRKSTRLNSSHIPLSRMPSSA